MSPPLPMLSASSRAWPTGDDWVLQPKWDGFRLLVAIDARGRVRVWSRHGTSLTARLSEMLAPFADVPPGSGFDGELVAIAERAGRPVQDFAAVRRAILGGAPRRCGAAVRRVRSARARRRGSPPAVVAGS